MSGTPLAKDAFGKKVTVYATDGTHSGTFVCRSVLVTTGNDDGSVGVYGLIFNSEGIREHVVSGKKSWDFIHVPGDPWPNPRSRPRT